ncbi:hypothetical protein [Paenisporosarcina cavernae]|uniref:Uncharacterized protein n=1 Tax=Paenisporosarcina cavernae TaxID=2320858 RepID=A0A385YTA3_9BACL|nr:hypothetical protein [Paenisporosarcina cavernae]AYC29906.1 hypothetical protein D3873_08365 [Paenisporosarcina cavernae]
MKKFIAIILAVSVLSGAGTIYAKVSPSIGLSNWFSNSFMEKSVEIGESTSEAIFTKVREFQVYVSTVKQVAKKRVEDFTNLHRQSVLSKLSNWKEQQLSEVEKTSEQLKKRDFSTYTESLKLEETMDQEMESLLQEIVESE